MTLLLVTEWGLIEEEQGEGDDDDDYEEDVIGLTE